MTRFLPYILKTLWRHRSRTLLTLAGSAVALYVFCFVGAVQEGMEDLRNRQAQNRPGMQSELGQVLRNHGHHAGIVGAR